MTLLAATFIVCVGVSNGGYYCEQELPFLPYCLPSYSYDMLICSDQVFEMQLAERLKWDFPFEYFPEELIAG